MQDVMLSSGRSMPAIGLGLYLLKDKQECEQAVEAALAAGYRHFDTAQWYENEQFVGPVLNASGVKRDELFVTTKIKNDNLWWDDLIPSFDESLKSFRWTTWIYCLFTFR